MIDHIKLCYEFNTSDRATVRAMRDHIIPWVQRKITELTDARRICATRADWSVEWVRAGLVTDERRYRVALLAARKRLRRARHE